MARADSNLTSQEVLKVAHAHLVRGVEPSDLAVLFDCNPGTISVAVRAVKWAIENPTKAKDLYEAGRKTKDPSEDDLLV